LSAKESVTQLHDALLFGLDGKLRAEAVELFEIKLHFSSAGKCLSCNA